MSKKSPASSDAESFEIIETAIDSVELLTRAFDVISRVCDEAANPWIALERRPPEDLIN